MTLTPAQQAFREGKITASFLPNLMAGDEPEIFDKWLELIGDPTWKPKQQTWPMAWGSHGEPFILNWHQEKTGHAITRRGESVPHPTRAYVGCTLDGVREFDSTVLDSKVCNAWTPVDEIVAFYTPQLICQRACVQCERAALVLVHGSSEPAEYLIEVDADYEATVWERVEQFWDCVQNLLQPITFPKVVPPEQWSTIDLDRDGAAFNWAGDMKTQLEVWALTKTAADDFDDAVVEIKKLLPVDCGKLFYGGVIVRRNKAGAVSIKHGRA